MGKRFIDRGDILGHASNNGKFFDFMLDVSLPAALLERFAAPAGARSIWPFPQPFRTDASAHCCNLSGNVVNPQSQHRVANFVPQPPGLS